MRVHIQAGWSLSASRGLPAVPADNRGLVGLGSIGRHGTKWGLGKDGSSPSCQVDFVGVMEGGEIALQAHLCDLVREQTVMFHLAKAETQ